MITRTPRNASSSFDLQSLESRRLMAADFIVESINVTDGLHTTRSELTTATITVKNIGNSTAPAGARLRMRFSGDAVWGNSDDLILNYKTMPSVAPGATYTYTTNQRASAQPTGAFRFLAYVDGYGDVAESNEDNNVLASADSSVIYSSGEMTSNDVYGTPGRDVILLSSNDTHAFVTVNGVTSHRALSDIPDRIFVDAGDGNDVIYADPNFGVKLQATGSTGHDRISGGAKNDELSGGVGMDRIWGRGGHDFLLGGGHNDWCWGEAGDDLVLGGGGNDWLYGGDGTNWLIGMNGNDRLFSKGNVGGPDTVSGNTGTDLAEVDPTDGPLAGIETFV